MATKVKLLKGFAHDGKTYREGDEYEGSDQEIELLARQGYCKPKGEKGEEDNATTTHISTQAKPAPKR